MPAGGVAAPASAWPSFADQTPIRAEPLEDRPAVSAPAEGAIDIDAVGADGERIERFCEQYGFVHRGSQ